MTAAGYTRAQVALHWAVAVLVVLQYAFAVGMASAFEQGMKSATLTATAPAVLHMANGTLIFALMATRLLLRLEHGAPPAPDTDPAWQARAARAAHWGFYALALALPVTGGAAWFQASAAMAGVHEALRAALLALIALHAAAALHGQFARGNGVLARMRP